MTVVGPLMTQEEAANYLRRPKSWLANRRYLGLAPAYTKIGKFVYYSQEMLDAFIAASESIQAAA